MTIAALSAAVEAYAAQLILLSDQQLGEEGRVKPADGLWAGYSDIPRDIFFILYQELRERAAIGRSARMAHGPAISLAQECLARHQHAYRDLLSLLLGVRDDQLDLEPAENEWPLRKVLEHMLRTEHWGFYARICHALEQQRQGMADITPLTKEQLIALYGEPDTAPGTLSEILSRYAERHNALLSRLSSLSEAKLEAPSLWWEEYPVPVRFRILRFDAHLREHTIQVEKTLAWLGQPLPESRRLVRLLYSALADLESAWLGGEAPAEGLAPLVQLFSERAEELAGQEARSKKQEAGSQQ